MDAQYDPRRDDERDERDQGDHDDTDMEDVVIGGTSPDWATPFKRQLFQLLAWRWTARWNFSEYRLEGFLFHL